MSDLFQQNRLLLNGVEVHVKLWPGNSDFILLCPKENLDFNLALMVCKVTPVPAITLGVSSMLQNKSALYPYTRTEMRAFHLQQRQYSFHLEDLYQQSIPSEIIIGMVDYKLNPFDFEHFDISTLGLYVDDESLPAKPLKMNFKEKNYIAAYNTLFGEAPEEGNDISRADYSSGYTVF